MEVVPRGGLRQQWRGGLGRGSDRCMVIQQNRTEEKCCGGFQSMGELVSYRLILLDVIVGGVYCMCHTLKSILKELNVSPPNLSLQGSVGVSSEVNEERVPCAYSNDEERKVDSILLQRRTSAGHCHMTWLLSQTIPLKEQKDAVAMARTWVRLNHFKVDLCS